MWFAVRSALYVYGMADAESLPSDVERERIRQELLKYETTCQFQSVHFPILHFGPLAKLHLHGRLDPPS